MPGEAMHQKGADGARRAKTWLDATTRVRMSWTNEDAVHASRLEFEWPFGGQPYSFDVGGMLCGGEFEGHFFVAECKNYADAADQGTHYDDWVAKCYLTRRDHHRLADHFMWITWHPFRVTKWKSLCSPQSVIDGLLLPHNRKRIFGVDGADEAKAQIDQDLVKDVADRLWLLVLAEKQEKLVITPQDRALIISKQVEKGEM
ncbi:hypothetical protein JIX56_20015 [Streptomyces sp. CA-210063]|uniref:hypothetical protein n=1 Tax=Streptomyces TaxID=1883 RepID=UPI00214C4EB3|nr:MULTISPECIES: hypothetical protein [Streptomyces]UUU32007.1 hypothetical protein JIX56_20015 [Streptomyces sp. CA-210063]